MRMQARAACAVAFLRTVCVAVPYHVPCLADLIRCDIVALVAVKKAAVRKLGIEPRIRAMAMFNYLVERHGMPPTYKEQVKAFISNNKKKTPAARMG